MLLPPSDGMYPVSSEEKGPKHLLFNKTNLKTEGSLINPDQNQHIATTALCVVRARGREGTQRHWTLNSESGAQQTEREPSPAPPACWARAGWLTVHTGCGHCHWQLLPAITEWREGAERLWSSHIALQPTITTDKRTSSVSVTICQCGRGQPGMQ